MNCFKYILFLMWTMFFICGFTQYRINYSIIEYVLLVIIYLIPIFIYFKHNKAFNNSHTAADKQKDYSKYQNTILNDGKTIKEHQAEDLKNQEYLSSEQAKKDFPKEINEQYKYIINHMDNRSDKYTTVTKEEEIIIKTFLEKVSFVRKKYSIHLIRFGHGMIRIEYNGCPTGQFNLRENNYVRILRGMQISDKDNVSYHQMLKAVDSWVRYCKYQLKQHNWYGTRI